MFSLPDINISQFIGSNLDTKTKELFKLMLDISTLIKSNSKRIIINGGFAVDLAVGEITRPHDDLNLVVFVEDIDFIKKVFINNNFNTGVHGFEGNKYGFTIERDGLSSDIDSVGVKDNDVYDIGQDEEKWIWPIKYSELIWQRNIENITVEFLCPTLIYDFKKRQQRKDVKRQKESSDFEVLTRNYPYLKSYKPK